VQDPRSIGSKTRGRVLSVSECEARVSDSKRDGHVSTQRDGRVSTKQRETRVQHCMSSRYKTSKSPQPQGFETIPKEEIIL